MAIDRALLDRIEGASRDAVGHALFTITRFDPSTLEVERVHSSNPIAYPIGGRKQKRDTEFSRRILLCGETMVCEGDIEIAAIFDDHALIGSLGLHSSINVPVLSNDGSCVGVVNFLMAEDRVSAARLAAASAIAADADLAAALMTR
jgi:hypothetical protein